MIGRSVRLAVAVAIGLAVAGGTATPAFAEGAITKHVGTFADRPTCEGDGEDFWKKSQGADYYVCVQATPTQYELYVTWYT